MIYSIWDIETNNLVAEYENRLEALKLVATSVRTNGPADAESLSLDVENESGVVETLAYGDELVTLALEELSRGDQAG